MAGNETTRNATSGGMHALLSNPDQFEKLRANIDDKAYVSRAIDEILRWATPVQHFRRTAADGHRDPRPGDQGRATRS